MKKLLTLFMALLFAVTMISCTAAPVTESKPAEAPTTTTETETQPQPDEQIVVGFANIAETAYQHTMIKESMQREADARGWKLIYMNNALDGQTAVSNATQMLQMGIDYFIEFNVDISVAPTIMEAMKAANVPVIAVDIQHEGAATYFGANNYGVGPIVGEYLGNLVKDSWGDLDCILIVEDSISGETVLARTDNVVEGYRKVFADFPDDKVFKVDGGVDTTDAQKVVADFLSAHPDFHKIAVCPAHVTYRLGASAAIETAGREKDCILVSQGEYDYLDYLENTPEAPEWEVYRATLVYDFQNYGKYCFEIIDKMVAGQALDSAYYPAHYIIDRSNVMDTFASYFETAH